MKTLSLALGADVLSMFTLFGNLGQWLFWLGLVLGVVGLVLLIMETMKQQASTMGWVLFVIWLVVHWVAGGVSIG